MTGAGKKVHYNKNKKTITTFTVPISSLEIEKGHFVYANKSQEEIIDQASRLLSQGNISEAARYYQSLLDQGVTHPGIFSDYGVLCIQAGLVDQAINLFKKSITLFPNHPEAHLNLGEILRNIGKIKEAELSIRKAIEIKPHFAEAHMSLGNILRDLGDLQAAENSTRKAIQIKSNLAEAHMNLGNILRDLGDLQAAENSTRKAIQIKPNHVIAYSNLGCILQDLGKLKEAELSHRKAISLDPNYFTAFYNLGLLFTESRKPNKAINFYIKALEINKDSSKAKSGILKCKGEMCDWSDEETQKNWLNELGIEGEAVEPLTLMYSEDSASKQLQRSANFYRQKYSYTPNKITYKRNKKLRIGYFSADFYNHATMYLMIRVFELHDKSEFEVFAYDYGNNVQDEMTLRLKNSVSAYRDLKGLNDIKSVNIARDDNLDIAVDLKGYTYKSRLSIFAHRVAPIQISYLGYPGSLGAECIDYIIADKVLIPNKYDHFYSEKVIRLPDCYQCNDNTKPICQKQISRKDYNLPDKSFVFTCFNANKKITSKEFDIWMRLLKEIEGSVLWLYKSNAWSAENLYKEARKRYIDTERIIFADKLPLDKHLARHKLGDLALDTFNYNGHTTTSDALWAGLPVLTKAGESFAARVSASQLTTIGLSELITNSEKEYEQTALRLAKNSNELSRIKSKLLKGREHSPLFNSSSFTRNLENEFKKLISQ